MATISPELRILSAMIKKLLNNYLKTLETMMGRVIIQKLVFLFALAIFFLFLMAAGRLLALLGGRRGTAKEPVEEGEGGGLANIVTS